MKPGRLIRRYEHNYFSGWVVSTKRQGRRWARYFSDHVSGRADAWRRAQEYRKQLLSELPWPSKVKRQFVRNTTGEIGVARVKEQSRSGVPFVRYVATWPTRAGKRMKASFSINLYGESRAKLLAVRARRQGLAELGIVAGRAPSSGMRASRPTRG